MGQWSSGPQPAWALPCSTAFCGSHVPPDVSRFTMAIQAPSPNPSICPGSSASSSCHTHIGNDNKCTAHWNEWKRYAWGGGGSVPCLHPQWAWHLGSTGGHHTGLCSALGTHQTHQIHLVDAAPLLRVQFCSSCVRVCTCAHTHLYPCRLQPKRPFFRGHFLTSPTCLHLAKLPAFSPPWHRPQL